jgi:hypothetical protein
MVPPLYPPTATRPLAVRHNLFTSAETLGKIGLSEKIDFGYTKDVDRAYRVS